MNRNIAIIGMYCRSQGADNPKDLWNNLLAGNDLIQVETEEDNKNGKRYIKVKSHLNDTELFDGAFFGYTPKECEQIDPQQRIFLETVWHALENAGQNPLHHKVKTGIFAGTSLNRYFLNNVYPRLEKDGYANDVIDEVPVGTTSDYLTTRIAYKLNLDGPCVTVHSTCASSLVSVCMASQSLVDGTCDMAIAGGVSLKLPVQSGYYAQRGGMFSLHGKCRPYDADADGSLFTSGTGAVVLKRLDDAVRDGDNIHAVIRGWAVNNDGSDRIGFTAPGIKGQSSVIKEAQNAAGVSPEDVSYIEGHGSATPLGDQIEVEALKEAFSRSKNKESGYCALGSIKGNIGHTDAASGVLGLIKAALVVKNKVIPPSINFNCPQEDMELEHSPFYVNTALNHMNKKGSVLAGVNSFGLGGTNAHVIVMTPPVINSDKESSFAIIPFSAKTKTALHTMEDKIKEDIQEPEVNLCDYSYTMALGRTSFSYRSVLIAKRDLEYKTNTCVLVAQQNLQAGKKITYLFPGVGDVYVGAGYELYKNEKVFRDVVDSCALLIKQNTGEDIREYLYPKKFIDNYSENALVKENYSFELRKALGRSKEKKLFIEKTSIVQPTSFVLEYALCKLMESLGVRPDNMIGHSIGEYVAACISGVFSLENAIALVVKRAQLIEKTGEGAMLALPIGEKEIKPLLTEKISMATVNTDDMCVVSGDTQSIQAFKQEVYEKKGLIGKFLPVTHAFHSHCINPISDEFVSFVATLKPSKPAVPFLSNVTGKLITDQQAIDPNYWGTHLVETVRFADAAKQLLSGGESGILVEMGVGYTLESFCETICKKNNYEKINSVQMIPSYYEDKSCMQMFLEAVGKLWISGTEINWGAIYNGHTRKKIEACLYPFEGKYYWIEKPHLRNQVSEKTEIHDLVKKYDTVKKTVFLEDEVELYSASKAKKGDERPNLDSKYVMPRDELDEKILKLWIDILGYNKIGIHDNFFSLGGHSLMALQLLNKIYQEIKVELTLSELFENPTIAKLHDYFINEGKIHNQRIELHEGKENEQDSRQQELSSSLDNILKKELGIQNEPDKILSSHEVNKVIPDLIGLMKRKYKFQLYPNELDGKNTPALIYSYLEKELKVYEKNVQIITTGNKQEPVEEEIVFLLSSVRSGSTLLRIMLAGHDSLFSPPELHLFNNINMEQRELNQESSDHNQGIILTLRELLGSQDEADILLQKMVKENWSVQEVMNKIIDLSKPRILVDKSPGYSNHLEILERISKTYVNAKYIYLVRNPYSVMESVVRNRFVNLLEGGKTDPYDFGEFLWTRSNSNIMDFLSSADTSRYCTVKYEELIENPTRELKKICRLLNVPFTQKLLTPYEGRRMRDGLGDPNFMEHTKIDATLTDVWRKNGVRKKLGYAARMLANELGYEVQQ